MILNKLPHKKVKTAIETIDLYQLGNFNGSAYTLIELQAQQYYPPHVHHFSEAKLHIILGKGIIILGKKENNYGPGSYFVIARNTPHGFKVKEQTLFLSIETPPIIDPETQGVDVEYIEGKKKGGKLY